MTYISIDPGTTQSAYILWCDKIISKEIVENQKIIDILKSHTSNLVVLIEKIASYGMPIGATTIDTIEWIGRFQQVAIDKGFKTELILRKDVKMHHCFSMRAKDSNIRQALLDRWGGRKKAIGLKKTPGPLYGIAKDIWSSLAILTFYLDTHGVEMK